MSRHPGLAPLPAPRALFEPLESRRLLAGTPLEIEGVQPASLDQPRINAVLRRGGPQGQVVASELEGYEGTFNVQAFYDTGASGILLSEFSADALGVQRATHNGQPVKFFDVGVAGSSEFAVSEELYFGLAAYHPDRDIDNIDSVNETYAQTFGPHRAHVGPPGELENPLLEGLDVFGMPLFTGKTVVMDARPVNTFEDTMRTYVYDPGTPYDAAKDQSDPGIPATSYHVRTSYASFDRFTKVTPAGAPYPSLRENPFVGPNPLLQLEENPPPDDTPGITITRGGASSTGSWLLDTGAAASILSLEQAINVGVTYKTGTYQSDDPLLVDLDGNTIPNQFQLTIGGIGGSFTAAGFFLDTMTLPTVEGTPIVFKQAPVIIADISVFDEQTGDILTLEGVLGMNYFVASAFVDQSGDTPGFGEIRQGAFDWLVFDDTTGTLGLELADFATDPRPAVAGLWVNSTTWTDTFRQGLEDRSIRSGANGFALSMGGASGVGGGDEVLPWANIDQVTMAFTTDVELFESDLFLFSSDPDKPIFYQYDYSDFDYDPQTHIATWTLTEPIGNDRVTAILFNQVTGQQFGHQINVLPGDVNEDGAVNIFDTLAVRNHQGTRATDVGGPPADTYSPSYDFNGDGAINIFDTLAVRNRQGNSLPDDSPALEPLGTPAAIGGSGALFSGARVSNVDLLKEQDEQDTLY